MTTNEFNEIDRLCQVIVELKVQLKTEEELRSQIGDEVVKLREVVLETLIPLEVLVRSDMHKCIDDISPKLRDLLVKARNNCHDLVLGPMNDDAAFLDEMEEGMFDHVKGDK